MSGLNRAELIGNLGRDPEVKEFGQDGNKKATFSIATSEKWTDKQTGEKKEKSEWHRIIIFGGLVDVVERFLVKGSQVYVSGKLSTRKWQDQEGKDRYITEVVLSGFNAQLIMLGGKRKGEDPPEREPEGNEQSGQAEFEEDVPF